MVADELRAPRGVSDRYLIIPKAAYPQLFSDIKVHKFVLDFYKDVYGVSEEQAKALRSEQILDWTVENDF